MKRIFFINMLFLNETGGARFIRYNRHVILLMPTSGMGTLSPSPYNFAKNKPHCCMLSGINMFAIICKMNFTWQVLFYGTV